MKPEDVSFVSSTLDEQETTVSRNRGDDRVRIWSNVAADVRAMLKDERFTLEGYDGHGAFFTIPVSEWNPVRGAKRRRNMTNEQKQAAADRLRKARENK